MKIAKVKNQKEFYKKFPTEEHFFKAYPKARYGYALAEDGKPLQPAPPKPQPGNKPGSGTEPMDTDMDPNPPGTPPDMSVNAAPVMQPTFGQRAQQFGEWAGRNAGDMWATGAQLANVLTPPTPVRQNINPYQMAINSNPMGTGSHASYANGGKMKKGKKADNGTQMPYVNQFQPQQPLDWDKWNAFHANQYQNNPQYGSDALNHGNFNNAALEQWNKANPQQAIPQSDIIRYQQEGANDPTVRKEFGASNAEGILGQKTTGYSKRKYTYIQANAQGTPYYTEEHGTHPLAAGQQINDFT